MFYREENTACAIELREAVLQSMTIIKEKKSWDDIADTIRMVILAWYLLLFPFLKTRRM